MVNIPDRCNTMKQIEPSHRSMQKKSRDLPAFNEQDTDTRGAKSGVGVRGVNYRWGRPKKYKVNYCPGLVPDSNYFIFPGVVGGHVDRTRTTFKRTGQRKVPEKTKKHIVIVCVSPLPHHHKQSTNNQHTRETTTTTSPQTKRKNTNIRSISIRV